MSYQEIEKAKECFALDEYDPAYYTFLFLALCNNGIKLKKAVTIINTEARKHEIKIDIGLLYQKDYQQMAIEMLQPKKLPNQEKFMIFAHRALLYLHSNMSNMLMLYCVLQEPKNDIDVMNILNKSKYFITQNKEEK